jgi:hypothetical protein
MLLNFPLKNSSLKKKSTPLLQQHHVPERGRLARKIAEQSKKRLD